MFAILASKRIKRICKEVLCNHNTLCREDNISISNFFESLKDKNVKYFIIEMISEDKNDLYENIEIYCSSKNRCRLIVIAPEHFSGDLLLSKMVKKGETHTIRIKSSDTKKIISKKILNALSEETILYTAFKIKSKYDSTKKIMFLNVSSGAGSTSISAFYANYLASKGLKISLLEFPLNNNIYEKTNIKFLPGREKKHDKFPTMIIKEDIKNIKSQSVSYLKYIVSDPNKNSSRNWNVYDMLKLLEVDSDSDQLIIDVGKYWKHNSIMKILPMIDYIFVVLDANNIYRKEVSEAIEYFIKYRAHSSRISFIFNKYDKSNGVKQKAVLKNLKPIIKIEMIKELNSKQFLYSFNSEEIINTNKQLVDSFSIMSSKVFKELYESSFYKQYLIAEGDL